ncbi:TetR/AcrR family transcriptional regulator [Jannaschia pohangensis]|uniref:Transcriptional regulator, TetR family n=1 Tax=Jannaschia pohangensis TaxID=390807 RepID=A0A1I3R936_9RHOB|nr:TetR/AcrR family transcriptional regulator [Jannaschia pohangensis]SFJ41901.1 transcriptional regulator, TetR family [Jannaschia pohangensis]
MSTTDRRANLRDTLIDLARETIAGEGTSALKARTLAAEAGCSVGSIYNVFGDMHELVMAVNGETFRDLGQAVTDAIVASAATTPTDRMITMAEAYLAYAAAHPQLWRALFDVPITETSNLPSWYLEALDELLSIIDAPVSDLFPDLPPDAVRLRTRALFSSIHGIVLLGIEERISSVGKDNISDMIRFIVESVGK